jgi:hypothetical protein
MKSVPENCYLNSHQYEKAKSYTAKNASEFVSTAKYETPFHWEVTVFWDGKPCCLVDIYGCLQESTASIIRVGQDTVTLVEEDPSEMSQHTHQTTMHHTPHDRYQQTH